MRRTTMLALIAIAALLLAGCIESSEAGHARANAAAMQTQMSEMSGLVSKIINQNQALIDQNQAIQSDLVAAVSQPNNTLWLFVGFLLVLMIVGVGFAIWRVDRNDKVRMAPQMWQPQYTALPSPAQVPTSHQLPANAQSALDAYAKNNGAAWTVIDGKVTLFDPATRLVQRQIDAPVALLKES